MTIKITSKPTARPLDTLDREFILKRIEECGRICYRSADRTTEESASGFVKGLVKSGHLSVLEHINVSFLIICSRACSHQLVRHRLASYSQASQRYIKYQEGEFYNPGLPYLDEYYTQTFEGYKALLDLGMKPQEARLVLPNGTLTELVVTTNLRQWKHMIALRTSKAADDEIRALFLDIQRQFREVLPEIFGENDT
jgi:thymidylate synthase (FAD)